MDYSAFMQYENLDVDYGQLLQDAGTFNFDPVPASNTYDTSVTLQGLVRVTPPDSDSLSPPGLEGSNLIPRVSKGNRQRLERRGHTKSRRGCYNCKRRRIKCQETHPACGHCVKTGLKCEYPALPQINHQPHDQIPLFSLQDMRFFQHFLTQCYPHHPLGQEEIWTHEIPCIAHNHEFLMHAILGLSASELTPVDKNPGLLQAAMIHRIKAIRAIKRRLTDATRPTTSYEEANAMIATCYALTFQSVSLDDGLAEYMTFIRGIVIVGMQMMFRGIKPIFTTMVEEEQNRILEPLIEVLPLVNKAWADDAAESIANLKQLCAQVVEVDYVGKLMAIVEKLYVSSWDGYKAMTGQYGWWLMLPHGHFQQLLDTSNQTMILLHTHWIALSQIMAFITDTEFQARAKKPSRESAPDEGFVRWLRWLNAKVDDEHRAYNRWPQWVTDKLEEDSSFFGGRHVPF